MYNYLDKVDSPGDLKSMSMDELNKLSNEIRKFIISTVADTGGHLASNLGVVELTLALHYHLNSPKDKIIWDVGHQCYTHKILTGRKDKFHTIRQYKGLSGYPKSSESIHDIIETGHSSTSISSALGLALARDLKNRNDRVYSIIGDGALTAGMAFEALNHAGHLGTNMSVILNDNNMSISPNVGALSHYLSNIRIDPRVHKLKEDIEFIINRIPRIGNAASNAVERIKDGFKYILLSGILFEEIGFTYIGPLDGHNISELVSNFKNADRIEGPVLIHVNTRKGKGYRPAENQPSKYHGVSPFKINNGESKKERQNPTYSQIFGKTMVKIGKKNQDLIGITAAMPEGTGLSIFRDEYPERFFDVGIAEQHAVTLATGLAKGGKTPVVALYSSFLQRAYDQLIHDTCIQNLPVVFAVDRGGIVGSDGETHQGVFDLSFLRVVPNMTVMAPKDENELQHMLYTAIECQSPTAVRYSRGEVIGKKMDDVLKIIPLGKAEILKDGRDLLILAVGSRVYSSLKAAELLQKQGIDACVINSRFIKPLDKELIIKKVKECNNVITAEEQVMAGGFGSAVLELLNDNNIKEYNLKRVGLPDEFIPHGNQEQIRSLYKLDETGITQAALDLLNKKVEGKNVWPRRNA
ncbi:MAG: 1-deoxy-D-xylulose-5-phosphate synthase [Halothermotrichaceae bacterium]